MTGPRWLVCETVKTHGKCYLPNISSQRTRRQWVWVNDVKPVAVSHRATSDPGPPAHTHTHIWTLPLSTATTLRLAKQELFLKTPPPPPEEPLHFLSIPAPSFLPLWCRATLSSWRRCSVMCPSRASNVVTGPGTTGLHQLKNAAAWTYGSAEMHPGRNTEARGVSQWTHTLTE